MTKKNDTAGSNPQNEGYQPAENRGYQPSTPQGGTTIPKQVTPLK